MFHNSHRAWNSSVLHIFTD
uniref:Uncharacterized protein n=1 Tax=Anguilla anguilla TaxID=7936 RepID=A0A0E9TAI8_ANGAN